METLIQNQSTMNGTYDDDTLEVLSTIAEVTLVEGISAAKTANKTYWANGNLEYTIVITNETDVDYETPTFSDSLNPLSVYVSDSFTVNGSPHACTYAADVITASLPTIPGGGSLTIRFLVQKA